MTQYRFGMDPAFELLVRERLLLADGQALHLGSRAMDLLIALVERAGQVVSRRELMDRVWPDAAVEENNLNVQIAALRKLLGSGLIATRPGRGYCFTLVPRTSITAGRGEQLPRLRTNLPATLRSLFGRARESTELEALVQAHRLVTLVGPGGVGKTLLAQHLLRRQEGRFRHGVCIVELASLSDDRAIAGTIAATLQLRPGAAVGLAGLVREMAALEMLLVLDNAEHLSDGVARVAAALHDAAPGLRLLVTSQAPLKVSAERVYRLGPLSVPGQPLAAAQALQHGAIALFVDRAQAADARFVLGDDAAALAIQLCRALDGLPLAIELAAWRAPVVGLHGLVEALHDPLRLLVGGQVDVPQRLQTLRHALAWSHALLAPRAQAVLRRISLLQGTVGPDLLQAVAADPPGDTSDDGPIDAAAVADAVATLVERSLLGTTQDGRCRIRYRLLQAPRAFAAECLDASGERSAVEQRQAFALAGHFARAYRQRCSGSVHLDDWEEQLLPDTENAQAALAWLRRHGEVAAALSLLPGLILATPREQVDRHGTLLDAVLDLTATAPDSPDAACALVEATYRVMSVDSSRRRVVADRALHTARRWAQQSADRRWLYRALCESAMIHLIDEETEAGRDCLVEARAIEDAAWPAVLRKHRWLAEVWLADRLGDGPGMYHAGLHEFSLRREAGFSGFASGVTLVNSTLAGGHAEEAVHQGLVMAGQLDGTRHLAALAEVRSVLTAALIACGRLGEAQALSRLNWPQVARQARKYEWAEFQALIAARQGRLQAAALLLGYAEAAYAAADCSRTFNELTAYRQTWQLLTSGLADDVLQHLLARGRFLDPAEIPAIAFEDGTD